MARIYDTADLGQEPLSAFHGLFVQDCAFSGDNLRLATVGAERTAMLWSLEAPAFSRTDLQTVSGVSAANFSPDVQRWAAASPEGELTVRAVVDGRIEQTIAANGRDVRRLWFSPAGTWLAAGDSQGEVRVVRVGAAVGQVSTLRHPARLRPALDFDAAESGLATSCETAVYLWELNRNEALALTNFSCRAPVALAFSPDGQRLAVAPDLYAVELYASRPWHKLDAPLQHNGPVTGVRFSPDGQYLASFGQDRTIRLWNPRTGAPLLPPLEHPNSVTAIAFSPDGRTLVAGQSDGAVRRWTLPGGGFFEDEWFRAHGKVNCVAFSPDGKSLLAGTDISIEVREAESGIRLLEPIGNTNGRNTQFSGDGRLILHQQVGQILIFRLPGADIPSDPLLDALGQLAVNRQIQPDGGFLPLQAVQLERLRSIARPFMETNQLHRAIEIRYGPRL